MRHSLRVAGDLPFSPDLPPVHVAADHEVGRAVPEVDTGEVTERIAELREAALCFQTVHQDLRGEHRGQSPAGDGTHFSLCHL